MKYLKKWMIFESTWSLEEFIQELTYHLGQYNLTVVYIRELISKFDIESEIEMGKHHYNYQKKLSVIRI